MVDESLPEFMGRVCVMRKGLVIVLVVLLYYSLE